MNTNPIGIPIPYASSPGLGKWDRIMTFGKKVQLDAEGNGIPFDFTEETFCQIVDNFSTTFTARRLGLDYKHLAANPQLENGPEQNLAYYSGLCVILNNQVVKLWDHFPDRVPPDPKILLAEMQTKFPRLEEVDGLWGYKSEITPLGVEKLPNCEQISPFFSKNDFNEAGQPIGYNILNISAVGVAFQDGTILNLSKSPPPQKGGPLPLGKLSYSPSTRNQTMNDNLSPEMMGKLMKHGLMAETDADQMRMAYEKYMSETEDGPTDRKMMADMYAKCMKKMAKMANDGLTTEEADEVGDQVNKMAKFDDEQKDMAKMGMEGMKDEDEEEEEPEKKKMKKMGKFQKDLISELSSQNKMMADRLNRLEEERKKREAVEAHKSAVAFAKQAILEGRAPQKAEADLIELAQFDMKKAERMIAQFDKGTYTVMQKWTQGGSTYGNAQANQTIELAGPDANQSYLGNGQYLARGATLSEMSKKVASEKKIPLAEAQLEVLKAHPNLY